MEMPEFLSASRKFMDEAERSSLVLYLAHNPEAGDLIQGTGGLRKLRWALEGRGKRGGARVIYYFHSHRVPLFIISAYAKSVRDDLSDAEKNEFRLLTKLLARSYGRKKP